ncbi:MAG: hypothetical protein MN733_29340, partial [Nitrososphaera sp.]|nr:hypothetical protein [Nitrososphaera sp.]
CIILTTSRQAIAEQFAKLLSFYGVSTTIHKSEIKTANFPNGKAYNRTYERWDVKLGRSAIENFTQVFSISHPDKNVKLGRILQRPFRTSPKQRFARVTSVKNAGRGKVWDIAVEHQQHVFPSQWCYTGNCGEIWLESYGCCDLGALVLPRFVVDGELDKKELARAVATAVRFLDNVLDVNTYPLKQIEENCKQVRRIGLGVMGLHDMLVLLGHKYTSDAGKETVEEVFRFIKKKAYEASIDLAIEKGQFPVLNRHKFVESGFCQKSLSVGMRERIIKNGIRNCAILTIAPTGTTSICSGVTSGVEPMYAFAYRRRFQSGDEKDQEIVEHGPFAALRNAGDKRARLYESALDISVKDHLEIQSICQKHVDNAISKTINLPKSYTGDDLDPILRKYVGQLKGLTLYRDGSRGESPIEPLDIEEALSLQCKGGSCEI